MPPRKIRKGYQQKQVDAKEKPKAFCHYKRNEESKASGTGVFEAPSPRRIFDCQLLDHRVLAWILA